MRLSSQRSGLSRAHDKAAFCPGSGTIRPGSPTQMASQFMHMLNPYCGVERDPRGVVRLTICNAGSLNILGSAAINGVREGLEALATEPQIRVLVIAGQSEKSMVGGADIQEMAKLDQPAAETFITGFPALCPAERALPRTPTAPSPPCQLP